MKGKKRRKGKKEAKREKRQTQLKQMMSDWIVANKMIVSSDEWFVVDDLDWMNLAHENSTHENSTWEQNNCGII